MFLHNDEIFSKATSPIDEIVCNSKTAKLLFTSELERRISMSLPYSKYLWSIHLPKNDNERQSVHSKNIEKVFEPCPQQLLEVLTPGSELK